MENDDTDTFIPLGLAGWRVVKEANRERKAHTPESARELARLREEKPCGKVIARSPSLRGRAGRR